MTAYFIAPIILIVFSRPIRGFGVFGVLEKLGSKFLRSRKILVEKFLFDMFVCFGGGLIAPKTANIYLLDRERKVESNFGLCGDSLLNGLLPDIISMAILFGLGTDKRP